MAVVATLTRPKQAETGERRATVTDLRRTVRRRTAGTTSHRGRRIVVALEPGDVLAVREAGTRTWFRAPIGRIYTQVVKWNADAARAEKRAKRKGGAR